MASRIKRSVPVTVNDMLDGHVALDLECPDRLYLHGYLGQLQVGGQVIQFLNHRGYRVPSPACLQRPADPAGLKSGLIHPRPGSFTDVRPDRVCAGHGRAGIAAA
jgi:hypothetical protein